MVDEFEKLLSLLIGPYGVVVAEGIVIIFLWRLFREATAEARKAQEATGALTGAVNALVTEFKQWRESYRDFMLGLQGIGPRDEK